jgi:hypothetical protein
MCSDVAHAEAGRQVMRVPLADLPGWGNPAFRKLSAAMEATLLTFGLFSSSLGKWTTELESYERLHNPTATLQRIEKAPNFGSPDTILFGVTENKIYPMQLCIRYKQVCFWIKHRSSTLLRAPRFSISSFPHSL